MLSKIIKSLKKKIFFVILVLSLSNTACGSYNCFTLIDRIVSNKHDFKK